MEINVPFSIYLDVLLWKMSRTWYSLCLNVNGTFLNKKVKCKLYSRYIYQKCYDKCTQKKDNKDKLASFFLHQFYSFEENCTLFHLEVKIQFIESFRAFAIPDFEILNFTTQFQRCLVFLCPYKKYVKLMDVNSFNCLMCSRYLRIKNRYKLKPCKTTE